jgi:hypothetical protein
MLKTYQSTRSITLITYVRVEGDLVAIEFTGGTLAPKKKFGKYSTDNQKIQQAIESSGGFGLEFVCISEQPEIKNNEPDNSGEGWKDIEDVKTVQAAKDYLIDLPEVTASMVTNKLKVMEVAEKLKIRFPNLK